MILLSLLRFQTVAGHSLIWALMYDLIRDNFEDDGLVNCWFYRDLLCDNQGGVSAMILRMLLSLLTGEGIEYFLIHVERWR